LTECYTQLRGERDIPFRRKTKDGQGRVLLNVERRLGLRRREGQLDFLTGARGRQALVREAHLGDVPFFLAKRRQTGQQRLNLLLRKWRRFGKRRAGLACVPIGLAFAKRKRRGARFVEVLSEVVKWVVLEEGDCRALLMCDGQSGAARSRTF